MTNSSISTVAVSGSFKDLNADSGLFVTGAIKTLRDSSASNWPCPVKDLAIFAPRPPPFPFLPPLIFISFYRKISAFD